MTSAKVIKPQTRTTLIKYFTAATTLILLVVSAAIGVPQVASADPLTHSVFTASETRPVESSPSARPEPTLPDPISPAPSIPDPTASQGPSEPTPTQPDPTEPDPTEATPVEPSPTEPNPTEPSPTEPNPTEAPTTPDPTPPASPSPAPTNTDQPTAKPSTPVPSSPPNTPAPEHSHHPSPAPEPSSPQPWPSASENPSAPQYPGLAEALIVLNSETLAAGHELSINGRGFVPGSVVTFELHSTSQVLGTATATADGSVFFTTSIPTETTAGQHLIYAYDVLQDTVAELNIDQVSFSQEVPTQAQSLSVDSTEPFLDQEDALLNSQERLTKSNNRKLVGFAVVSFGTILLGMMLFNFRFKRVQKDF